MSRNDLFLLLACVMMATIISGGSSPRAPSMTIASLISPTFTNGSATDPTFFQQSFEHQ